jgi:hypothetical protein
MLQFCREHSEWRQAGGKLPAVCRKKIELARVSAKELPSFREKKAPNRGVAWSNNINN